MVCLCVFMCLLIVLESLTDFFKGFPRIEKWRGISVFFNLFSWNRFFMEWWCISVFFNFIWWNRFFRFLYTISQYGFSALVHHITHHYFSDQFHWSNRFNRHHYLSIWVIHFIARQWNLHANNSIHTNSCENSAHVTQVINRRKLPYNRKNCPNTGKFLHRI